MTGGMLPSYRRRYGLAAISSGRKWAALTSMCKGVHARADYTAGREGRMTKWIVIGVIVAFLALGFIGGMQGRP